VYYTVLCESFLWERTDLEIQLLISVIAIFDTNLITFVIFLHSVRVWNHVSRFFTYEVDVNIRLEVLEATNCNEILSSYNLRRCNGKI